jgi:hypothetical protein
MLRFSVSRSTLGPLSSLGGYREHLPKSKASHHLTSITNVQTMIQIKYFCHTKLLSQIQVNIITSEYIPWKSLRHAYELFFARIYRSLPEGEASFYICVNILKFGQESSATPQSRNKLLNQRPLHPRVRWQERSVAASVTWHSLCLFGKQCTWTQSHTVIRILLLTVL